MKEETLTIRMEKELLDELSREADTAKASRSAYIRQTLHRHLQSMDDEVPLLRALSRLESELERQQGTGELLFEIFARLAHSFFQRTYPTADVDNQAFHEAVRVRWASYICAIPECRRLYGLWVPENLSGVFRIFCPVDGVPLGRSPRQGRGVVSASTGRRER
jgi:Arc/MetJ-type ribon-helix-helix transcriptional regulator